MAKDSYVVKSGDTLYSIAREHGMDPRELIAMNGIVNPNSVQVGKVLKIKPQTANSSVASAVPVTSDVVVSMPIGGETSADSQRRDSNSESLKREPQAGKVPYSDQALAQAQNQNQTKPAEAIVAQTPPEAKPEVKPAEAALAADEISWVWPANGKIIGTFSEGANKGIDIAGNAGDPVIASGDGKVIIANFLRGYGKLVIVKHNKTYVSVYGHNRSILVKEGQMVTQGQKIAEMGNTDTDQVKLHFEIRSKGKPLDPIKFLPHR
ncbi:peptidoglycan DD-metalloendopeptidase family protein [Propionivibrio sp.]|uniref:peptidoglycan DD-metalloendopeptidase family protein n=1 Tax=Propionivibrio sp. TaxID=2212460 RepID=UPI0025E80AFC|nr:peptidoglycan DD-metalloendopeptidase family protein [Propionivibrio sp.]